MGFGPTRVLAGLSVVQPFPGPRELERRRGRPYKARLGANECLFGVSPAALRVLADRGPTTALYSDPTNTELRDAIAAAWNCTRAHVVVAEGIEGLLELFVRACIDPGDVAATSLGGYPSFDYYVRGCGGRLVYVPYTHSGYNDAKALVAAALEHGAKLVYLANPDNPTGTMIAPSELAHLAQNLPEQCLLLLDEAYVEFAPPSMDTLQRQYTHPALVRLRTFSKLYGLAGARVGYALADPEIVLALDCIRQHFAVSKLSQEMALAAFSDHAFVSEIIARTAEGRNEYYALARELEASSLPSAANFVAFDFGSPRRARSMAEWLEKNDIFVRHPPGSPLDRLVRITVGPFELRRYLSQVLFAAKAVFRT